MYEPKCRNCFKLISLGFKLIYFMHYKIHYNKQTCVKPNKPLVVVLFGDNSHNLVLKKQNVLN